MDKISKTRLIKEIADELGTKESTVKLILLKAASKIDCYAKNGQAVEYPGLGKFYPATRAARTCRNLQTGLPVSVPAKRVLAFKPGATTKNLDK